MKKSVFTFLLALTLLAGSLCGFIVFLGYEFTQTAMSTESQEVIYEVIPGKGFQQIATELFQQKVIKNATAFSLYARIKNLRGKIKTGEYLLNRNMKPDQILSVLTSGKSIARPLTISEGLNIFEIADLVEKAKVGTAADFMTTVRDPLFIQGLFKEAGLSIAIPPSLEGFLYPETYQVTKFTDIKSLVRSMFAGFVKVFSAIQMSNYPNQLSPLEIVTLASIIEKETGAPEERPLISSVFHNRMVKKMRLQTDPTIIYGIAMETGKVPENISRADILRPTKYNTYSIYGLPPGPISNPGRESLLAAMKPVESRALFFVSQNNGTHIFSETLEQHTNAVKKFQIDPKAREGKSWRDLKKEQH